MSNDMKKVLMQIEALRAKWRRTYGSAAGFDAWLATQLRKWGMAS